MRGVAAKRPTQAMKTATHIDIIAITTSTSLLAPTPLTSSLTKKIISTVQRRMVMATKISNRNIDSSIAAAVTTEDTMSQATMN